MFDFAIGLWPILSKFGLASGAVVALLAAAWFSPVFKKTFLAAAIGIVITTTAYTVGVKDGEHRVQAQWDAAVARAIEQSEEARSDAERDIGADASDGLRDDPYNRDRP